MDEMELIDRMAQATYGIRQNIIDANSRPMTDQERAAAIVRDAQDARYHAELAHHTKVSVPTLGDMLQEAWEETARLKQEVEDLKDALHQQQTTGRVWGQ